MSEDAKKKAENLSFEGALEKLENLVESMESGETPLEELVTRYEEGHKLLKLCQKRLSEAELKIEKLSADGTETVDFEPQAEA